MAKVTIVKCDRCGADIHDGDYLVQPLMVVKQRRSVYEDDAREYDLCQSCRMELFQWLRAPILHIEDRCTLTMKCRNCQYVECSECKTELKTRCPKCQPNIAMTDTFFGIFDYRLESQRVEGEALILTYVKEEPAKLEQIETTVEVK